MKGVVLGDDALVFVVVVHRLGEAGQRRAEFAARYDSTAVDRIDERDIGRFLAAQPPPRFAEVVVLVQILTQAVARGDEDTAEKRPVRASDREGDGLAVAHRVVAGHGSCYLLCLRPSAGVGAPPGADSWGRGVDSLSRASGLGPPVPVATGPVFQHAAPLMWFAP